MRTPAHGGPHAADQEQSDEIDAEAQSGVHMACIFQAGKLGIAAYDTVSAEVFHAPLASYTLAAPVCATLQGNTENSMTVRHCLA